mgnify:CR=1 FL=1
MHFTNHTKLHKRRKQIAMIYTQFTRTPNNTNRDSSTIKPDDTSPSTSTQSHRDALEIGGKPRRCKIIHSYEIELE